jgi:hypothetical protein
MSKADLKAAMELLQVKKPLRLKSRIPAFQTPEPAPEPSVISIPGPETALGSSPSQDVNLTLGEIQPRDRIHPGMFSRLGIISQRYPQANFAPL